MMLIVQLKLETRQLWGNNGKDETTATFFFYKNLIIKKGFFPKFDISTFSERCQTFGHVSNSFGAPHFGQMHLTEKNRYFIKMQFLYFPRSKKNCINGFSHFGQKFLGEFFSRTGFSLGRASRELK